MPRVCTVDACGKKHSAKGLCENHWKTAQRRAGKPYAQNSPEYNARWQRSFSGRWSALKRAMKTKGGDIDQDWYRTFLESNGSCVYCSGALNETGHGLDRMDSSRGYLKDNVIASCVTCNRIKNDLLTHEEMLAAMVAIQRLRNRSPI